jgi:hypothetical protein
VIHLEDYGRVGGGGTQFGALSGEEQNLVADDGIVDGECRWERARPDRDSTDMGLAEQPSTFLLRQ